LSFELLPTHDYYRYLLSNSGIIEAHLNNDPTQHARKINFDQAVDAGLSDGGIQAALAITGF